MAISAIAVITIKTYILPILYRRHVRWTERVVDPQPKYPVNSLETRTGYTYPLWLICARLQPRYRPQTPRIRTEYTRTMMTFLMCRVTNGRCVAYSTAERSPADLLQSRGRAASGNFAKCNRMVITMKMRTLFGDIRKKPLVILHRSSTLFVTLLPPFYRHVALQNFGHAM